MPSRVQAFLPRVYHALPFYQQNLPIPWPSYYSMLPAWIYSDLGKDFFLTILIKAYTARTEDELRLRYLLGLHFYGFW